MLTLAPGTHLGPFEILSHIGAGGMGDVYKARDTRLDRLVAIKTSKAQFNERFTREARAIAALNHPNIATLYDVGPDYLVMEFVDGAPVRGPLPHAAALAIAKQIAEAVEAAHEKGIIHRDLKPGNILVREDGSVKVLDFGLAKALDEGPISDASPNGQSTRLTPEPTTLGMILGTAAYMSPEQARGIRADRRADVFSFGVVLYELLTGQRLFKGASTGEILAAVIREEPTLEHVPANWRGLLERCLVKDPRQRLQAIGEARILLERGMPAPTTPASGPRRPRIAVAVWAIAVVLAIGVGAVGAAFVLGRRVPQVVEPPTIRVQILTPEGSTALFPQISPDGRTLAMVNNTGLWLRAMDSVRAHLVPGTGGARYPFWSPDSKNLGFFQRGKLRRVAVDGGPAVEICDAVDTRGGTWGSGDVIVFAPSLTGGLYRVAAAGGAPTAVLKATQTGTPEFFRYPSFLPDGQHILYQHSRSTPETTGVYIAALDGTAPVQLLPTVTNAVYAAPTGGAQTGRLLFRADSGTVSALISQAFDLRTLRLTGDRSLVAEHVGEVGHIGNGAFSVSTTGTLVYGEGIAAGERQMTWVDRGGRPAGTIGSPAEFMAASVRLSPDGKQVAYAARDRDKIQLYLQQVAGGPPTQIAGADNRGANAPVWSPDGTRVAFLKLGTRYDLFSRHLDGAGQEEPLPVGGLNTRPTDWSTDGKWLAYYEATDKTGWDIWLAPMTGTSTTDRKPILFLQTSARESSARFSPDGRWMAYMQEDAGRSEVFVQAVSPAGTATGIQYRVSSEGGNYPFWRRDGAELYFQGDERVMAASTTMGATFHAGPARALFDIPPGASFGQSSPDGQRFLMMLPLGEVAPANSLTVMVNWQTLMKK